MYALVGRDSFLRNSCVRAICGIASDGEDLCSPIEFNGGHCSIHEVFDELKTMPLLEERRIVCVNDAKEFIQTCSEKIDSWPCFSGKSVLILMDEKLDGRRKLTKQLFEQAVVVNCDRMNELEIKKWITDRIRSADKEISADAAERMVTRVGGSAAALDQAIEQLIAYTGPCKEHITSSDVDEAIPAATFEDVWKLTDGLAGRDPGRCLEVIEDLMGHGEPVYTILGAIAWHIRRLLSAKYLLKRGIRQTDVFMKLKVFPSRFEQFGRQLADFTLEEMKRNLSLLTETDFFVKTSGQTNHRLTLERAVLEICGRKGTG